MLHEQIITKQAKGETDTDAYWRKHSNIEIDIEVLCFNTWDKRHESNIMRIGMNEEMNQDINNTQLNSTKQKQKS